MEVKQQSLSFLNCICVAKLLKIKASDLLEVQKKKKSKMYLFPDLNCFVISK